MCCLELILPVNNQHLLFCCPSCSHLCWIPFIYNDRAGENISEISSSCLPQIYWFPSLGSSCADDRARRSLGTSMANSPGYSSSQVYQIMYSVSHETPPAFKWESKFCYKGSISFNCLLNRLNTGAMLYRKNFFLPSLLSLLPAKKKKKNLCSVFKRFFGSKGSPLFSVASLQNPAGPTLSLTLIWGMIFWIMFQTLNQAIDNPFFMEIIWVNRTRVKVSEDGLNLVFHRAERKPCSELPVSCNSIWNSLSI